MSTQIEHIKDVKTLHELLAIAIEDARAAMKVEGYNANSMNWHRINMKATQCSFCLAGAVMGRALGFDLSEKHITLSTVDTNTARMLRAIDYARESDWRSAFNLIHGHGSWNMSSTFLEYMKEASSRVFLLHYSFESNDELSIYLDSLEALLPTIKKCELEALAS